MLENAAPIYKGLRGRFEAALRENGLNPVAFDEGVAHLATALARREELSLADLKDTPLARVIDRYVATAEGEVSAAIYVYPPVGQWRRGASPALESLIEEYPGAVLAGTNVISAELRKIVWDDAIKATILGIVAVFILMWSDLGGPLRALLALLPLFVGMVWMLGAMALLGQRLNFFNIFVLTMIVGIGVDYGVHLLHRWYESGGDSEALAETAKAIAVAALTTMVGFGSLVVSHYPGLRSVGAAAILGALSTAILGITLLPALLSMRED
jgi:predicted exporter